MYLLGKTGAILRSGVEEVCILREERRSRSKKGVAPPARWFGFHTAAIYCIFIPPLLWMGFYIGAFFILPVKLFLLSFLVLFLPVLGVLGGFTPSSVSVGNSFELDYENM